MNPENIKLNKNDNEKLGVLLKELKEQMQKREKALQGLNKTVRHSGEVNSVLFDFLGEIALTLKQGYLKIKNERELGKIKEAIDEKTDIYAETLKTVDEIKQNHLKGFTLKDEIDVLKTEVNSKDSDNKVWRESMKSATKILAKGTGGVSGFLFDKFGDTAVDAHVDKTSKILSFSSQHFGEIKEDFDRFGDLAIIHSQIDNVADKNPKYKNLFDSMKDGIDFQDKIRTEKYFQSILDAIQEREIKREIEEIQNKLLNIHYSEDYEAEEALNHLSVKDALFDSLKDKSRQSNKNKQVQRHRP